MFMLLLALLPAAVLLVYIYRKDTVEKEPIGLLVKLFLLGAASVVFAVIVGIVADPIVSAFFDDNSLIWLIIDNFILTALVEEGGKYFMLRKCTWKSPEFNFTFDAVVYAVTVSLGFAALENVLYVVDGTVSTAIMRAVLSVPGHAIDGVYMGFYYGLAKKYPHMSDRYLSLALIVPTLLHGFYDFTISLGSGLSIMVFFAFEIIITVLAIIKVRKLSREDSWIG
ncbi:MAG: PrsW family intramembrane metalloprotease [Clostridiales bacterium]|nr:PrsW family intramembrane metalloprotease [Clostridiales bacterium]